MNVIVANGNESGTTVAMEVEPDATAVDVLNGLKDGDICEVDPLKDKYVVTVAKTGTSMAPDDTLAQAGVTEGDFLTVISSEHGY